MIRYSLVAIGLLASSSAFAQDTHDITINVEQSFGVEVFGGPVSFDWFAPPPGTPYSPSADSGSQSVQVNYTSSGEGGLYIDVSEDPVSLWGVEITATPAPPLCGTDLGSQTLFPGSLMLIDLTGFGSCAESLNVTYDANIVNESSFGTMNSGQFLTVTYTLF